MLHLYKHTHIHAGAVSRNPETAARASGRGAPTLESDTLLDVFVSVRVGELASSLTDVILFDAASFNVVSLMLYSKSRACLPSCGRPPGLTDAGRARARARERESQRKVTKSMLIYSVSNTLQIILLICIAGLCKANDAHDSLRLHIITLRTSNS